MDGQTMDLPHRFQSMDCMVDDQKVLLRTPSLHIVLLLLFRSLARSLVPLLILCRLACQPFPSVAGSPIPFFPFVPPSPYSWLE